MRFVFLDIDGVLNSTTFLERLEREMEATRTPYSTRHMIDRAAVDRLNRLLRETEAKVVISSSWRKLFDLEQLREILVFHGFDGEIVDVTPDLSGSPIEVPWQRRERGLEIEKWVADNAPDASFVIFDDDSDMGNLHHRFVQTTWKHGLLDEHIARARELLIQPT